MSRKRINWNKQPLGRMRDSDLADQLRVTKQAVHQQRTKRGIPRYKPLGPDSLSDEILASMRNVEIATMFGFHTSDISRERRVRGIPAPFRQTKEAAIREDPMLGKEPDTVIAARHETSNSRVSAVRRAMGIPRYEGRRYGVVDWPSIDWSKGDFQIAKENAVSTSAVAFARRRHGPED